MYKSYGALMVQSGGKGSSLGVVKQVKTVRTQGSAKWCEANAMQGKA